MFGPTLSGLAPELLDRLESAPAAERPHVVHDFIVERSKQDEMAYAGVKPGQYAVLEQIILKQVLPAFAEYAERRDALLQRKAQRAVWKYVLGTVLVLETAAALFTRGRIFNLQLFIPSLLIESLLGALLYYTTGKAQDWQIEYARSRLLEKLRHLDRKLEVDQQYDSFKEAIGADDLTRSEAVDLVSQYASPDEFWRDYIQVRRSDPTTSQQVRQLGVPRFESFLDLHAKDVYNEVARNRRFDLLFLLAHQILLERHPSYVLDHFASRADFDSMTDHRVSAEGSEAGLHKHSPARNSSQGQSQPQEAARSRESHDSETARAKAKTKGNVSHA